MSRYHSWRNQLSAILFQVPVFFSLMLLHYKFFVAEGYAHLWWPIKIFLHISSTGSRCASGVSVKHSTLVHLYVLMGGGPRLVVSTAAFHARVRGSVPGLGGLKETKNVSSPSTCESQYCGEPPWPRGSVLGLRLPVLEFRILCLEDSVISIISPSLGCSPGPV